MLNSVVINNVDGIHSLEINTNEYPLHDFDPTVSNRTNLTRQKSQNHGLWPTNTLRDGMEIHVEGDIFGIDSADYFDKRMALIAALFGDPNTPPVLTDRYLGDLVIAVEGSTENWTCPFTITLFSAPLQGLSPSRSSYAITFASWDAWFTGVNTGQYYYYA